MSQERGAVATDPPSSTDPTPDDGRPAPLRVRCLATTWDLVGVGPDPQVPDELATTWSRAVVATGLPVSEQEGGLGDLADREGEPSEEQRADIVGPHDYALRSPGWEAGSQEESVAPGTRLHGDDQDGYRIVSGLVIASIARLAGRRLMLHAAGVSDAHGRVAALVAESGTGKTTAARRLTEEAFGYVTDECVAIARDQSVLPFPKPLSFVRDASAPRVKDQRGPEELGLVEPPEELTLRRLVQLRRVRSDEDDPAGPDAVLPRLEEVGLLDAVSALVGQTSALPRMARPLHRLAGTVAQCGGMQRLVYREVDTTPGLITDLLATAPEPRDIDEALEDAGLESHPPDDDLRLPGPVAPEGTQQADLREGTTLRRALYTDAIGHGMAIIVMRGTSVVHLDGPGAQVWFDAREPRTVPELVESAREVFGDHPEAERLVTAAVLTLVEAGVLVASVPGE